MSPRHSVCDAKYGRLGRPYEKEIRTRDDYAVLSIISGTGYKNSKRADYRYWYRLAVREAHRRGLTLNST